MAGVDTAEAMLYARVADDPTTLRAWLAVPSEGGASPRVSWRVNGQPVAPRVLRPLSPVHDAVPSFQVAVVDFEGVGSTARVEARVGARRVAAHLRRQPADVPRHFLDARPGQGQLNVLLLSCFHHSQERRPQLVNQVVDAIAQDPRHRPDLAMLLGDQVYLDLPPFVPFADDEAWLARRFHGQYLGNWSKRLTGILGPLPSLHLPDDHEFWNNYPEPFPLVANVLSEGGRGRWSRAAAALYAAFQEHTGNDPTDRDTPLTRTFRIGPLDVLVADTRSRREPKHRHGDLACFLPDELEVVHRWAQRIAESREPRYGVFVSAQSLFVPPNGWLKGRMEDWELPNYRDYRPILDALAVAARPGRPVLALTGDLHWGRVLRATVGNDARRRIYEVIASPAALVYDPIAEVQRLFRRRDPYPRHPSAADPPKVLPTREGKLRIEILPNGRQRGDHVAVLRFDRRAPGSLSAGVTYFPIHPDAGRRVPNHVPLWP
jgi:hypothetical protein